MNATMSDEDKNNFERVVIKSDSAPYLSGELSDA